MEIALLLTSELVANAVLHGTGAVGVHMTWGEGGLRVGVKDNSPELPVLRGLDLEAPNGRGLRMVDGLASDWGVSRGEPGKTVWFSLLAAGGSVSGLSS